MIHTIHPLCTPVKCIIIGVLVLLGVTGCLSKNQPSLSPFTDESPRLEWPNIDIGLFIASAAHYYHDKGTWPQSVDSMNDGFNIWIKTLSEKDSKDPDLKKITPFKETFQIVEVIPIWHEVMSEDASGSGLAAGLNLLISDKPDVERDALAASFARRGGNVHRIGRFWDPPVFDPATVRVYGADSFCLVLQQKLGFDLCSPDDDLLLRAPPELLRRQLARRTLGEAAALSFPVFIKPIVPKQFRGAVYQSGAELAEECRGLPGDSSIFVAESVNFMAEARSFVLNGQVLDTSIYEGEGNIADAVGVVEQVIRTVKLPRTVIIDTGLIAGRGWAVVEFNAAWGAGLNGCDSEKILPAILAASETVPQSN